MSSNLERLERIVPQDISEWPPYAQVLYLQLADVSEKVETVIAGQPRIDDHERRIKSLEALRNWMLGILTAMVSAIAVAAALAQTTLGGKH